MTTEEIIEQILNDEKENLQPDADGNPTYLTPGDRGGRTTWGIAEKYHPEAWASGPPSRAEAAAIYRLRYVEPFGWVPSQPLKSALVDFGVVHGVGQAAICLQVLVGVKPDAIMGPKTRYWTERTLNQRRGEVLLTNALCASRLSIIDHISDATKSQKRFEEGWESRALRHLIV